MPRKSSPFVRLLTQDAIRRLAGSKPYGRGEGYFETGRVRSLIEHKEMITAKVQGTHEYRVKLWEEKGALDYECSCPRGEDGDFCKHCVAVGLSWLEEQGVIAKPRKKRRTPKVTIKDIRAYLLKREKTALVDLLMEQVVVSDALREGLVLAVLAARGNGIDLDSYKAVIDDVVTTGGFVDYYQMHDYATGIEKVADSLTDLVEKGFAAEVIELAEYALACVEGEMGSVDDSDGYMGGLLHRFGEVHHSACLKAKPDPVKLAEKLFSSEIGGDWDTFHGASEIYSDVLGAAGLARYRELAESEWAKVKPLGPGENRDYGRRFHITSIMERLARETGDVEAVVAVKSRDLSYAYDYLKIAETYKGAKQYDKALEWAEKGLKAFPKNTDSRLREFLADEYHRRKQHDKAMEFVWAQYAEWACLESYNNLKAHAGWVKAWSEWREKALAFLREQVAASKKRTKADRRGWGRPSDHSMLVEVFLFEGDEEAAWREAQDGGCSEALWLLLAGKREKSHPEDALPIYQARVEPTLSRTNDEAYRDAVRYLAKIRELMGRLGRSAEFTAYLAGVREKNKRKRNFIKRLDRKKW